MARRKSWTALVICVIVAAVCLIILLIGLRYNIGGLFFSGQVDHDKAYSYTVETGGEIDSLKIEWVNGTVELQISETANEISISEYGNKELAEEDQLYFKESGGVLTVQWKKNSNLASIFNWLEKDLVVEIPKALAQSLKSFNCETVSGDIQAGDFNAVDCAMESTSGRISAFNIQSDSLQISSVSGSVNVSETDNENMNISTTSGSISAANVAVQEIKVNTVSGGVELKGDIVKAIFTNTTSGSINIYSSTCPDQVDLSSTSGSIRLTLPENKGFTAKYSSVSGDFYSEFPTSSSSDQAVYEDGSARFVFETVSGDMKILCE